MRKEHKFRDLTFTLIAAYFCMQSFFIVFKMWTSLDFDDKVNAMETVLVTTVLLCEAVDILHLYKFNDLLSSMFSGELFGTNQRLELRLGELAQFRGKKMMKIAEENRLKNGGNFGIFRRKRWTNSVEGKGENCEGHFEEYGGKLVDSRETGGRNSFDEKIVGNIWGNGKRITKTAQNNPNKNIHNFNESFRLSNNERSTMKNNYEDDLNGNSEKFVGKNWKMDNHDNSERFEDENIRHRDSSFVKQTSITDRFGNESHIPRESSISTQISEDNFYGRGIHEQGVDGKLYKQYFSRRRSALIEEMSNTNFKLVKYGYIAVQVLCVTLLLVPLLSLIGYMTGFIKFENLRLPFIVYIPLTGSSSPDNIVQYVLIMLAQTLYLYMLFMLFSDSFVMAILSNANLKTEIKLFLNRLQEFDAIFCVENSSGTDDSLMIRLKNMRICEKFKQIVTHHQAVYRKLSAYKDLIKNNAVYIHSGICVELCISLFLLQGELFFKVKYSVVSLCLGLLLAQYSQEGQDLEDGFEEIRDALYEISWHNMSVSLRKSLVILIARHSLPPKVSGAYGIFVINRKNLSIIMRASYSYLNILNRIK